MQEVLLFASVLLPVVTALVELAKNSINISKNIVPGVSLVVGLVIGAAAYPFTEMDLILRIWAGGFAGLAGTGLFELIKKREGSTK